MHYMCDIDRSIVPSLTLYMLSVWICYKKMLKKKGKQNKIVIVRPPKKNKQKFCNYPSVSCPGSNCNTLTFKSRFDKTSCRIHLPGHHVRSSELHYYSDKTNSLYIVHKCSWWWGNITDFFWPESLWRKNKILTNSVTVWFATLIKSGIISTHPLTSLPEAVLKIKEGTWDGSAPYVFSDSYGNYSVMWAHQK